MIAGFFLSLFYDFSKLLGMSSNFLEGSLPLGTSANSNKKFNQQVQFRLFIAFFKRFLEFLKLIVYSNIDQYINNSVEIIAYVVYNLWKKSICFW